jgi:hypothetical protein
MNTHNISGPFQHGTSLLGYRFLPRTVSLELVDNGCSRSDYFTERTNLLTKLGIHTTNPNLPEVGTLRWEYIQDDVYTYRALDCYLNSGLLYDSDPQWHSWGIVESLEFVASDPMVYDPTEVIYTIDSFDDQLTLPMTFPFLLGTGIGTTNVTYDGSWTSYPIIEVTGPTNGFKIINETTGITIELDYFINVGITVTFDLSPGAKTVVDNLGNNLINHLRNSNLSQFAIAPAPTAAGGLNVIKTYVAEYNTDTEIIFRFFSRYIGI